MSFLSNGLNPCQNIPGEGARSLGSTLGFKISSFAQYLLLQLLNVTNVATFRKFCERK